MNAFLPAKIFHFYFCGNLKVGKVHGFFIIKIEQYNHNFKTTFNTIKIQNHIFKDKNYQYEISNQYDLKINVLKYNENDLKLNEKDIFYQIKIKKTKTVPFTGNRKIIPRVLLGLSFIPPIQFPLTFNDNEIQEPIRFPLTFHDNKKIIPPIQFPLTFNDNEIQEPKRKKRKIDKNENKSKMEENQLPKMYEDESSDDEIEQLIPLKFKLKLLKLNDKYVFQGQFQSLNLTDIQSFIGKVSTNEIEKNLIYDLTPNRQKINFQCNSNKFQIHLNFIKKKDIKKNHIKKSIKELKKRDPINNLICYKSLPPDECLEKDHRKTHQSCLILIFDTIIKNTINFINTKSKIIDIVPLKSKKDNSNVKLWPHDINDIIILNPPWSLAFDWSMKAIYYVKSNEHGKVILILPAYSGQNNYTKDLQLHHRLRLEIYNVRFGNYIKPYRYPVWVWCISKKENNDINKISAYTLNYNDIYQKIGKMMTNMQKHEKC